MRYGMDTIEGAKQPAERAVTALGCLTVFLSFFKSPGDAQGRLAPTGSLIGPFQ